jgi:HEAT repeat protein
MPEDPSLIIQFQDSLSQQSLDCIMAIMFDQAQRSEHRLGAVFALDTLDLELSTKTTLLLRLVDEPNLELCKAAIYYLGWLPQPSVFDKLRTLLWDARAAIQCEALRSLARLGDHEVHDTCANLLSQGNEDQRIAAIVSLGMLGRNEDLLLLEHYWQSLTTGSLDERLLVALLLGKKGNRLGEQLLIEQFGHNDQWHVEITAVLASLSNETALLEMRRLLTTQCSEPEAIAIRECFAEYLGFEGGFSKQWDIDALSWVSRQLSGCG